MKKLTSIKQFVTRIGRSALALIDRHQFVFLIVGAVFITLILTSISIGIYISSGAINIDLSRPGYESVRYDTADEGGDDDPFSPSGGLDEDTRSDFLRRIDNYQSEITQMNDFGGDSLSDQSLGLE